MSERFKVSERRFYAYCPDMGFETFGNASDAESYATSALEELIDGDTGWHENASDVEWGELCQSAYVVENNRRPAPEGSPFDELVEMDLHDVESELDVLRREAVAKDTEIARLRGQVESEWARAAEYIEGIASLWDDGRDPETALKAVADDIRRGEHQMYAHEQATIEPDEAPKGSELLARMWGCARGMTPLSEPVEPDEAAREGEAFAIVEARLNDAKVDVHRDFGAVWTLEEIGYGEPLKKESSASLYEAYRALVKT